MVYHARKELLSYFNEIRISNQQPESRYREFSRSSELFCSWRFLENFFLLKTQNKILLPNIELVFYHVRGVAPKNGPKVKKVDLETKKTTLKME